MGVAAFAISHYHRSGQPLDWARATQATQQLIPQLLKRSLAPSQFWNINFPAELSPQTSWLDCPLDPLPLRVKFRQENDGQYRYESDYHQRPRVPGGDVEVCFDGRIAVSRVEACAGFGAVTRTAAAHRL